MVWLALARRRGGEPEPALTAGTSFAVKAEIRPPYGQSPRLSAELVKGIIDGVVSAFRPTPTRRPLGRSRRGSRTCFPLIQQKSKTCYSNVGGPCWVPCHAWSTSVTAPCSGPWRRLV